jgi:hypothetical protein
MSSFSEEKRDGAFAGKEAAIAGSDSDVPVTSEAPVISYEHISEKALLRKLDWKLLPGLTLLYLLSFLDRSNGRATLCSVQSPTFVDNIHSGQRQARRSHG